MSGYGQQCEPTRSGLQSLKFGPSFQYKTDIDIVIHSAIQKLLERFG